METMNNIQFIKEEVEFKEGNVYIDDISNNGIQLYVMIPKKDVKVIIDPNKPCEIEFKIFISINLDDNKVDIYSNSITEAEGYHLANENEIKDIIQYLDSAIENEYNKDSIEKLEEIYRTLNHKIKDFDEKENEDIEIKEGKISINVSFGDISCDYTENFKDTKDLVSKLKILETRIKSFRKIIKNNLI